MVMNPTPSTTTTDPTKWWHSLMHYAYFYREAAAATFIIGIYLHVSRLVFGDDLLMQYLLTPTFDKVHAVPMTYAAIAGLAGWKHLRFRSGRHRIVSMVTLGFIAISVPLHVATYFGASMARFSVFPRWYSFLEGAALYPFLLIDVCRLRVAEPLFEAESLQAPVELRTS
jgi:hypothetical protein